MDTGFVAAKCVENPCVGGSIPPQATSDFEKPVYFDGLFALRLRVHVWVPCGAWFWVA